MMVAKNWELHLKITARTRAEARIIQSLISDVTDKRSPRPQVSAIINGTRRYLRRDRFK